MKTFIFLPIVFVSLTSWSQTLGQSTEIVKEVTPARRGKSLFKLGISSSTTDKKVDLRSMKTGGSDESESTTVPNLTYTSLLGVVPIQETTSLTVMGFQSVNPVEDRTFSTSGGRQVVLPGQTAGLKLEQSLTKATSLDVKVVYVDTYGITDPSMGFSYFPKISDEWTNKQMISLSAPTSEKSKKDKLSTRLFLRTQWGYMQPRGMVSFGLSHVHLFFKEPPQATGGPRVSSSGSRGVPGTGLPPVFSMNEVDLILMSKEEQRTSANFGYVHFINRKMTLGASLGATLAETVSHKQLWYTNARVADFTYRDEPWEAGASLSYTSDIEKFKSVSLPNQLNAGIRFSYFYGNPDLARR